ncbi:MAG: DUF4249 domain-containing protein [Cellulophaga sp.]
MIKKIIYLSVLVMTALSCEDVIDVDLEKGKEKLVVDASINWYRNFPANTMEIGANQKIRLTTTAGFYDGKAAAASDAIVTITNDSTNEVFAFVEEGSTGEYKCSNFKPIVNNSYELNISYKGENFTAKETLIQTPIIDSIKQKRGGVFDKDEIVLNVHYKDDGNEDNFYYFDYITSISKNKELSISDDQFTNGNETFEIINYEGDDKIKVGDTFDIEFYEISSQYYQFLDVLTYQIYTSGIFDPAPAEVKGNVINTTTPDNYAYGYFRVVIGNKAIVTLDKSKIIED